MPQLLDTMSRSLMPAAWIALIRFSGLPHRPKPPDINVIPSRMPSMAARAEGKVLSIGPGVSRGPGCGCKRRDRRPPRADASSGRAGLAGHWALGRAAISRADPAADDRAGGRAAPRARERLDR